MYVATVNDDSLKNSLKVSVGLHIVLFLFLFFGLPHLMKPLPEHHDPVPFEIVTLADMTTVRNKDEPEPQKPPAPQPKPEMQKPAPAPPPPTPAPPAPAKPDVPAPVEKAEALKPLPKDTPKPVEKPKPPADLLASVLKDVAKMKPAEQVKAPDTPTEAKTPAAAPAAPTTVSMIDQATIADMLRSQLRNCWYFDPGRRNADTLVVELNIDVNPDRTVANTDIVDKGRYATDSFFRAAADAAVRAVRNPKCTPLNLPPDKYDEWKHIDFTFDPRDML